MNLFIILGILKTFNFRYKYSEKVKVRLYVFILANMAMHLFLFYYLIVFCAVYPGTSISVIQSSVICLFLKWCVFEMLSPLFGALIRTIVGGNIKLM
jgi:hypothetical protein